MSLDSLNVLSWLRMHSVYQLDVVCLGDAQCHTTLFAFAKISDALATRHQRYDATKCKENQVYSSTYAVCTARHTVSPYMLLVNPLGNGSGIPVTMEMSKLICNRIST
ncbi:hypothetical protein JOB18_002631 [Solea senegalensis]|uniref:Uncharacterized protein n=1 Tax=Solea senegalensis TaxID=28829 RepID=A0AAV6RQN6_SOLSE|nr:hypothetical protein JOB18_002631 [Solea senegalensis]